MKKIIAILTTLVLIFSLCAYGAEKKDTIIDTQKSAQTVYLKWTDGEELLENVKCVNDSHDKAVFIYLDDGTVIETGYANVIIIENN